MLIDFLRYQAFHGSIRGFSREGYREYIGDRGLTGIHLRVAQDHVYRAWRFQPPWLAISQGLPPEWTLPGVARTARGVGGEGVPRTFEYENQDRLKLEVILDVDPTSWSDELIESRPTDFGIVTFRRAGPAVGHLNSGDLIFDCNRGRKAHGTLAGIFRGRRGNYGLTCGHVAGLDAEIACALNNAWLPRWAKRHQWVGRVRHNSSPPVYSGSRSLDPRLDAALVHVESSAASIAASPAASPKPIAAMVQEEPVHFGSSTRKGNVCVRVAAVTIWKAMDLYRDGTLRDVSDVLMLGHAGYQYVRSSVSRPGDSGAAVRGGWPSAGSPHESRGQDWYGMLLGGDQCGAYASYAELLWHWAVGETSEQELDFTFGS